MQTHEGTDYFTHWGQYNLTKNLMLKGTFAYLEVSDSFPRQE